MERYIALLRGVNVGGNNKVAMSELKALFEREGFADVSTYINSGNVIFSSEPQSVESLGKRCEAMIEKAFGFSAAVCVISAGELAEALDHAPAWWNADENSKHNAIFVIPPAKPEDIYAQVGQFSPQKVLRLFGDPVFKPEYEKAAHYGRVIFWSAPLATYSRTRLSRVVGTPVYGSITIRNANTALKLRQLTEQNVRDI